MKKKFGTFLTRYIPVRNQESPTLAKTVQRLIWNTGIWANQSLGIHWLAKFAIICFISTNLTQVARLVLASNDSTRMFETFSILSFCGMGNLKLFNLYFNRKRWQFIISQVKFLENEELRSNRFIFTEDDSDIEDDCTVQMIKKYTKRHAFITSILLKIYSITAIIFIATPFVEYAVTSKTSYPHILPGWAPLDSIAFTGYFTTVIFETVASVYCVFVHVAFDCTSVGIMIFICGQFTLLRRKTQKIAGSGKDCMPSARRDAHAHVNIIESHCTHVALCTVIKELDLSLRGILGVYFLVATLTVCSVAIRLNSETLSFMQLVSLLQYMCGTLTQLFLFCRYGDAVFHEVTTVSDK